MSSILRSSRSIKPIFTATRPPVSIQAWRRYGQSGYGHGEPSPEDTVNQPTRDIEHPGPPPPDTGKGKGSGSGSSAQTQSQPSSSDNARQPTAQTQEDIPRTPSNKAHPTITSGRQSANVDEEGNTLPNVPEDVKRHNEDIDQRHDKPHNRIKGERTVEKGFWKKLDGS